MLTKHLTLSQTNTMIDTIVSRRGREDFEENARSGCSSVSINEENMKKTQGIGVYNGIINIR